MIKIRKIRRPHCGSFDTIKNGKREGSSLFLQKLQSLFYMYRPDTLWLSTCVGKVACQYIK